MEPDKLHSIAQMVWEAMSQMSWREKKLDELEREVQQVVNQVGHQVMQDFLVPARVQQIQQQVEAGQIRCQGCEGPLQRHKQDQAIHPKTIFGQRMTLCRHQYYCPRCQTYPMRADPELGLVGPQMTPRLAVVTALCGASWPHEVASAFLDFTLGVKVPAKTVQRVTRDERVKLEPLKPEPLDQPPGVVTMDGVLIRGREKEERLEMKVGSFFSQVVPVSKDRQEVMDASFVAGAMAAWQEFVEPVRPRCPTARLVADGSGGVCLGWGVRHLGSATVGLSSGPTPTGSVPHQVQDWGTSGASLWRPDSQPGAPADRSGLCAAGLD